MSTDTTSSRSQSVNHDLVNRSSLETFCLHLKLLLKKNYLLFSRNLKPTLCQALAPVFFCLIIIFFQATASGWANYEQTRPPDMPLHAVPKCHGKYDCITIGYSIIVSN